MSNVYTIVITKHGDLPGKLAAYTSQLVIYKSEALKLESNLTESREGRLEVTSYW